MNARVDSTNAPADSAGPNWVDLDTVVDYQLGEGSTLEQNVEAWASELRERGVEARVLQLNGPAGGNPLVRYTGDRKSLVAMMKSNFEMGDEEVAEYFPDHEVAAGTAAPAS